MPGSHNSPKSHRYVVFFKPTRKYYYQTSMFKYYIIYKWDYTKLRNYIVFRSLFMKSKTTRCTIIVHIYNSTSNTFWTRNRTVLLLLKYFLIYSNSFSFFGCKHGPYFRVSVVLYGFLLLLSNRIQALTTVVVPSSHKFHRNVSYTISDSVFFFGAFPFNHNIIFCEHFL